MVTIGLLTEPKGETRVGLTPQTAMALQQQNCAVWVEANAGVLASYRDTQYEKSGALIHPRDHILKSADVLISIHPLSDSDRAECRKSPVLIGMYQPLAYPERMQQWAEEGITAFSLDMLPRTTRAQSMDVLSSQSNIAGYKAVLRAAELYPRYFPMLMTAAGSIPPAKVLILGAGVAGLQAIATARRLGAVVEVFDTRPAVKEEVMSLGAKFVEVEGVADASKAGGYAVEQSAEFQQRQQAKIAEHVAKSDVVITTAQIPGKKAPLLVTDEMLQSMRTGSVIIDLAAATGGNTAATENGRTIVRHGVTIVGDSALFTSMPADASMLLGKNIHNFLKLIIDPEGTLHLNFEDELVQSACVVHEGQIWQEKIRGLIQPAS